MLLCMAKVTQDNEPTYIHIAAATANVVAYLRAREIQTRNEAHEAQCGSECRTEKRADTEQRQIPHQGDKRTLRKRQV